MTRAAFLKSFSFGIASIFALLFSLAPAATDMPGSGLASLGAGSTGKVEVGLLGLYAQLPDHREPQESGFYSKARIAHFVILLEEGRLPFPSVVRGVSYDALVPGFLMYGAFAIPMNELGLEWGLWAAHIVSLANGEMGYRYRSFSLGLVNGIHPFFHRRVYHDAGLRLGYGKDVEWGLTVFEEDRFRKGTVQYGVKLDLQGYWGW